jgi:hypothetical protein
VRDTNLLDARPAAADEPPKAVLLVGVLDLTRPELVSERLAGTAATIGEETHSIQLAGRVDGAELFLGRRTSELLEGRVDLRDGATATGSTAVNVAYSDLAAAFNTVGVTDDANPAVGNLDGSGYSLKGSTSPIRGLPHR